LDRILARTACENNFEAGTSGASIAAWPDVFHAARFLQGSPERVRLAMPAGTARRHRRPAVATPAAPRVPAFEGKPGHTEIPPWCERMIG